jgi:hypothetical protein
LLHGRTDDPGTKVNGMKRAAGMVVAVGVALTAAMPAAAQQSGLGAASQAGRVKLTADGTRAFTDARAERSVRRALRRHGFSAIDATCTREPGASVADCTVSATDAVVWTGTATVTFGKRAYRVEYLVSG